LSQVPRLGQCIGLEGLDSPPQGGEVAGLPDVEDLRSASNDFIPRGRGSNLVGECEDHPESLSRSGHLQPGNLSVLPAHPDTHSRMEKNRTDEKAWQPALKKVLRCRENCHHLRREGEAELTSLQHVIERNPEVRPD
jgi:hypothetical protein